jgi:hypothetical protein
MMRATVADLCWAWRGTATAVMKVSIIRADFIDCLISIFTVLFNGGEWMIKSKRFESVQKELTEGA